MRGSQRRRVRQRRRALLGFVAGVSATALLAGGGSAWALWTASTQGTSTARTNAVTVAVAAHGLDASYTNEHSTFVHTGSFTVTNTSGTSGTVGATVSGGGSLAAGLPIRIWPASTGPCTAPPPPGATSGRWDSAAAPAVTGVAPAAAVTYCVRTEISVDTRNAISTPTGAMATHPVITASLTTAGWSAKTATVAVTQSTQGIYPLAGSGWLPHGVARWFTVRAGASPSVCLDVKGGRNDPGTPLLAFSCGPVSNQAFELVPVATGNDYLVTLRPANALQTRAAVDPVTQQQLTAAAALGGATGAEPAAQRWYVQRVPGNRWSFVSALDGRCLTLPGTSTEDPTHTGPCTGSNVALELRREPVTFAASAQEVTVSWGIAPGNAVIFNLQTRPAGAHEWSNQVTNTGPGARTFTFSTAGFSPGTHELRISDFGGGTIYGDMTMTVDGSGRATAGSGFG
ncbi:hypothetical protein [Leucobacter luti]|uniref:hypothetical protein n=1 Tax=Leucobacter luti TaxID=340320 RepID=UPI003CFD86A0